MKRRVYEIQVSKEGKNWEPFRFFAANMEEAKDHANTSLSRNRWDHGWVTITIDPKFVGWQEDGTL
jgi:hypothetical protein